jgi:hypothetical protein
MSNRKIDYSTAQKETYLRFCSLNPEIHISFAEYKQIIKAFGMAFRDYLLNTGDRAKLPWGLGSYAVSKKKTKPTVVYNGVEHINLAVDFHKTKLLGKVVYHLNTHTDGYKCKWFWFEQDSRFPDSDIFKFAPERNISRKLAEYLKNPDKRYIDIYNVWARERYANSG